jgi:acyl carrier protein
MSEEQITSKFIDILRGYVKDPALLEKATQKTHILKDLKVNSARLVDIIIKCEDVFGCRAVDPAEGGLELSWEGGNVFFSGYSISLDESPSLQPRRSISSSCA